MPPSEQVKALLPLTPPVFHILLALAGQERHGYAIMQDVAAQTNNTLQMGPGTLYGCLKRMLAAGLVEESAGPPTPEDAPAEEERRRYYRMTPLGHKVVREEARRLSTAVHAAHSKRVLRRRPNLAGGKA